MPVALYARVSTERQERQQTIDSQLAALRAWAVAQGHPVSDEQVFRDEGYSGSRLDRPGLDALRDAVRDGIVSTLVVLAPDRLARKYAYQVLLLEEFRRAGAEVVFLQHPISDDPDDQLLLQIQGAIAEYERAVLGERFRRGKLQKARDGHYIAARAPYGYRYVPRRDAVPGRITVDEQEAELVRRVYGWFTDEQTTIRQVVKRLNAGPDRPRSGRAPAALPGRLPRSITSWPTRSTPAPPMPTATPAWRRPSRPSNAAHARPPRPGAASSRASSGSPFRCRRWSTKGRGTRRRPNSRATQHSRSATTPGTATCCAACSNASFAGWPCMASPAPRRRESRRGKSTDATARIAS